MQDIFFSVQNHQVFFSYFGKFSDDVTSNIIEMLEPWLLSDPDKKKAKRKVAFLIAECFQNVVRHSTDAGVNASDQLSTDNFQLAIDEREINITSINVVDKSKVSLINEMIDEVNSSSAKDLKRLKQKILSEGVFSEKGGAGLGIIEMARKTGLPIRKKFRLENDGKIIFVMTLDLVFDDSSKGPKNELTAFEELYDHQRKEGVVLAYKGDLSKEATINLIELLELRFIAAKDAMGKHLDWFHVMVELLQNAAKHATRINDIKPGYFAIQLSRKEKSIVAGNFLNNHQAAILKNTLEKITSLSPKQLEELHLSTLGNPISALSNASLGLIEVAKISNNRLHYTINPSSKGGSFYNIAVNLS